MKTTLVVGLLAALPLLGDFQKQPASGAVNQAAPVRTVVVSLNRVSIESAEGRAANQRLQAVAQKLQADLAAKQKELPQPNATELQRLAQQTQAEFVNAQRQAQTDWRAKLNPVVSEIATQHGADVVLNGDTLVWSAGRLDVTDEVIAKLDAPSTPASGK